MSVQCLATEYGMYVYIADLRLKDKKRLLEMGGPAENAKKAKTAETVPGGQGNFGVSLSSDAIHCLLLSQIALYLSIQDVLTTWRLSRWTFWGSRRLRKPRLTVRFPMMLLSSLETRSVGGNSHHPTRLLHPRRRPRGRVKP